MISYKHLAEDRILLYGKEEINTDAIRLSLISGNVGLAAIGGADRSQKELTLDSRGIAYVDMNHSGRLRLGSGETGLIATSSLAGCTGVAGYAKRVDGSTAQFVSHYDAISQTWHFTHLDTPLNSQMYGFRHDATEGSEVDGHISLLVAYPASERHNPAYGKRDGSFDTWTYLDQLETTAGYLGDNVRVLFLPYHNGDGNSLAAGRTGTSEGIYWNGVRVDFEQSFNTDLSPASASE